MSPQTNGKTAKPPRKFDNTKTENYVRIMGYLGADPKIYATINGNQYAIFRMATFEKGGGESSTWFTIKMWGKARMVFIRNNLSKEADKIDKVIKGYEMLEHRENIVHALSLKYELLNFAGRRNDANATAALIAAQIEEHDMNAL